MPAPDWKDDELLSINDLTTYLGYESERSVERLVEERLIPRPTVYGRKKQWRFGLIRKWKDCVEFMQQHDIILPEPEPTKSDRTTTKKGHSPTNADNA